MERSDKSEAVITSLFLCCRLLHNRASRILRVLVEGNDNSERNVALILIPQKEIMRSIIQ